MSEIVKNIIEFCDETGLEIISYGLAPNPNGFCFEGNGTDDDQQLWEMLQDLNSSEELELKNICFG